MTSGTSRRATEPPRVLVLMGVSGVGKSTVGALLAAQLGCDFAEGDELHPPRNVARMAAGVPLTDADRAPWLSAVRGWIDAHVDAGSPGVITCSALKRGYRDRLRAPGVVFVMLAADPAVIARRLADRHGHFMPPRLLGSQLEALEPPAGDEPSITVAAGQDAASVCAAILRALA